MARIVPEILRKLREDRSLSLGQLAQKTEPRIDRQTIHRIEKGEQLHRTQARTLHQLARALNVAPGVLTGEQSIPDDSGDADRYSMMSKLNLRISTSAQNALHLVSDRFNVTYSEIIELAPFLFCWAAEASLQQRRERLKQVEFAFERAQNLESEIEHLAAFDASELKEKLAAERQSIEDEDLFGLSLEFHLTGNDWTDNPFSLFLHGLAQGMDEGEIFEGYAFRDFPSYRICAKEAENYTGGDAELVEKILEGYANLRKMPENVRENWSERPRWIREEIEQFRSEMDRRIEVGRTKRRSAGRAQAKGS